MGRIMSSLKMNRILMMMLTVYVYSVCVYSSNQSYAAENCALGHGYNFMRGTCEPCPRGFYRIRVEATTAPLTPQCKQCPLDKTTARTKSLSQNDCTLGLHSTCHLTCTSLNTETVVIIICQKLHNA